MECSINNPALSLLMKHLVIGQRQKAPNFSAFHWSPYGSLVSIGQNFVTTKVVHLPKRTETSLITESDQSGPIAAIDGRTAWSDSDQAVRTIYIAALAGFIRFQSPHMEIQRKVLTILLLLAYVLPLRTWIVRYM